MTDESTEPLSADCEVGILVKPKVTLLKKKKLIDDKLYWVGFVTLFIYIVIALNVILINSWPCSITGNIWFPVYIILTPMISICHTVSMKVNEGPMEWMEVLYNCIVGFSLACLSISIASYLSLSIWSCSNSIFHFVYIFYCLVSVEWLIIWLHVIYMNFLDDRSSLSVSYLLMIRCACIPSNVRKLGLLVPTLLATYVIAIDIHKHWNDTCHAPLNFYCFTAIVAFLLIGTFMSLMLFQGPTILDDSMKENAEYPCSMVVIFYAIITVHVFCLVWAVIGVYWLANQGYCSRNLRKATIGCVMWLIIIGTFGIMFTFLFRVEKCFPVPMLNNEKLFSVGHRKAHKMLNRD